MSSSPMPWIIPQFFTNAGEMASFYQLFTYQINSTTKQDTFEDSALITANDNPIVLDQYGRAPIFLSLTSYKFVLATPTASDPPAPADIIWTADNVPAYSTGFANFDITGVAGETIDTDNNIVYLSDGSDSKIAGRWYLANALNSFSSSGAIALGVAVAPIVTGDTGTIRIAGRASITVSTLTVGALYYISDAVSGRVTSTPPAQNLIILGKADSTSSLIIEPAWGAPGTFRGLVSAQAETFAGAKSFASQPRTYIGADTTLPATIGGIYFRDVTQHNVVAGQTNSVMSSTTIPANALNAEGKSVIVYFGTTVASTGPDNTSVNLDIGGTSKLMYLNNGISSLYLKAVLTRVGANSISGLFFGVSSAGTPTTGGFTLVAGYDFTAAIALRSLCTTGATAAFSQTYFMAGYNG